MKKIVCLIISVVLVALTLSGCGFSLEDVDVSQYVTLCEHSTFEYSELVEMYEKYRAHLSSGYSEGSEFTLADGYGLDFRLTAEIVTISLDENGKKTVTSAERYEPWCFDADDNYVKNYEFGENPDNAKFDTGMMLDPENTRGANAGARTIKIGEAFSFFIRCPQKNIDSAVAGKDIRFTVKALRVVPGISDDTIYASLSAIITSLDGVYKDEAEDGDWMTVTYKATVDGESFDGGETKDYELQLGKEYLPPEIEDALLGHKKGDTVKVETMLPENFQNAEVAGKNAVYEITVGDIYNVERAVKANTEFESVSDLKYALKVREYANGAIISKIVEKSEVTSRPPQLVTQYEKYYKNEVESTVKSYVTMGYKEDDVYDMIFGGRDSARAYVVQSAENSVRETLVTYALLDALGEEYTDEDYKEDLELLRDSVYYYYGEKTTAKELERMYTREILRAQFIYQRCSDIIYGKVTVNGAPVFPEIKTAE